MGWISTALFGTHSRTNSINFDANCSQANRNRYNYLTPSKTPKRKKGALKATVPQSKHNKQKAKRTLSFPKTGQTAIQTKQKKIFRTYMQRDTMTEIVNHSRSIALERSVKFCWVAGGGGGAGLNRFYVATTLALSSAVVYTRQIQDISFVNLFVLRFYGPVNQKTLTILSKIAILIYLHVKVQLIVHT